MKKKVVLVIIGLVVFFNYLSAQKPAIVTSDEPGWQKIGETTASFKKQNESIHVFGADEFTSIRLEVLDAPLSIERLQVFYESGEMEDIKVKSELKQGGETQSIRLKYPDKDISKVAFTYQTTPNSKGEKANVILYGMKAEERASYRTNKEEGITKDVDQATENTAEDIERSAERTFDDIDSATEEAGDVISEATRKGAAEITDQRHETKVGPDSQTIYIDDTAAYYYINSEGRKVYVSEIQLKDKKDN